MTIEANVIADSISQAGARLTTLELRYPKVIHGEFMTHRAFCLAGDAVLEFDLPGGSRGKYRRVHRMRIDDFVSRWLDGADRTSSKPKEDRDLSWVNPTFEYPAIEVASKLGMATAFNINSMCRSGSIHARKGDRGEWLILGREVIAWRTSVPEDNRFDIKSRLAGMRIRQLNEDTGDIQYASVSNACRSGMKDVFEIRAGDYHVAASRYHRILTGEGWRPLGSIEPGQMIVVRKYGKPREEYADPLRLKKIDGVWRSRWQLKVRAEMAGENPMCRRCGRWHGTEIHHIVPVYIDPSRSTDLSNVTLLCGPCHQEMHSVQGWQGGSHLYGGLVKVDEIIHRGVEPTYDLEIAGTHPNFVANGVIVHNSRNASSSRAIPWERMKQWVLDDPYIPIHWGANQRGMQAVEEIGPKYRNDAICLWLTARDEAVDLADDLAKLGIHKQIINRLIEPFCHINVIVTATDYANFFALRIHKAAMPEIQCLAVRMACAIRDSIPVLRNPGEWHLPYVLDDERDIHDPSVLARLSTARCARLSYKTFEGKAPDFDEDMKLCDRLIGADPKHSSPAEHQGYAATSKDFRSGNFTGWIQHRRTIAGESAPPDFDWLGRLAEYEGRDYMV
jgi:hypothetical protein